MATRTFADLAPRVSQLAVGCPRPMLEQHIRDAAIRACERTLAWRYQIPKFNLQPGVAEYVYAKPAYTDVHAMFAAMKNNVPLTVLTLEQAIERYPAWADLYSGQDATVAWESTVSSAFNSSTYNCGQFNHNVTYSVPESIVADASEPMAICQLTPDKFIILPLPDDATTYVMRMFVALKPSRDATGMDKAVMDDLEDVIFHGALQHLLTVKGQSWEDRELAAYHAKQFSYQLAERRARANLGAARGTLRVRMQPFGA